MTADQVAATDNGTPEHEPKLERESSPGQYSTLSVCEQSAASEQDLGDE
jgi:hypothetical protein